MTGTRRIVGVIGATGLLVGLVACGGSDGGTSDDSATRSASPATSHPSASSPTTSPARSSAPDADAKQLLAAGATALQKLGKGTVTSIEAARDHTVWEVKVVTSGGVEHDLYVSRAGKKVVSGPRTKNDDAEDKAENRQEVRGAKLDYRVAAKKVLAARQGRLTELNLDDYRNKIVWEADVYRSGTKYEVKIDAATGKVIKNSADHDGDDDDDD